MKLNINGKVRDVTVEPDTPLLWVIREQVGLTGTKYGCGVAQCGACSVHVNGKVQRSCAMPVSAIKATVRLLPVGTDHGGGGTPRDERESERQGHRRGDDEHLPLWHLPENPQGRAHGSRGQPPRGQD